MTELVEDYPDICRALAAWIMRWDLEEPDGTEVRIAGFRQRDGEAAVVVQLQHGIVSDCLLIPDDMEGSDPGLLLSWVARRLDPIRERLRPVTMPVLAPRYSALARAMLAARVRWEDEGHRIAPRLVPRRDAPGVGVLLEAHDSGRFVCLSFDRDSPSILKASHLADLLDGGLAELLDEPSQPSRSDDSGCNGT